MARRALAKVVEQPLAPENKTLIAAIDRLTQTYDRWMRLRLGQGGGTTEARLKLLFLLEANGPQKMSDLAKSARVAARTLTTLIDGLEREGLARRTPHESDRRATMIELTDAGAALADANAGPYWAAKGFLFNALSDEERIVMQTVYERWIVMVEADLKAMQGGELGD